ncbi:hypothetical protein CHS0354_004234, partial [Potamilus streckersoni]
VYQCCIGMPTISTETIWINPSKRLRPPLTANTWPPNSQFLSHATMSLLCG